MEFNDWKIHVMNEIKSDDFVQEDPRFNRTTWTKIGYYFKVPKTILSFLRSGTPLPKYREDWARMNETYQAVLEEVKINPDSRRLVVLNDLDYLKVYSCFLSMQFLRDKEGRYNVLVYQRSGDIEKLKDDLVFFSYVMKKFEKDSLKETNELTIVYGSIHATKE